MCGKIYIDAAQKIEFSYENNVALAPNGDHMFL